MSDTFAVGDWAARVGDGPPHPSCPVLPPAPPLNMPVLVIAIRDGFDSAIRAGAQGIKVAGYPCSRPNLFWNADYFRKVPPPEPFEEPRRATAPVPVPA